MSDIGVAKANAFFYVRKEQDKRDKSYVNHQSAALYSLRRWQYEKHLFRDYIGNICHI